MQNCDVNVKTQHDFFKKNILHIKILQRKAFSEVLDVWTPLYNAQMGNCAKDKVQMSSSLKLIKEELQ